MKLYDGGRAPNPRLVRIFLAEKGASVPIKPVDMGQGEHTGPQITQRNPLQRLPVLELDDGRILTESVAICRYLDEVLEPASTLFGADPFERARVDEWTRRIEFNLYGSVAAAFRHLHPAMAGVEVPQIAAWGEANKGKAANFLRVVDDHLAQSRFLAGERFTIADITGLVAVDFMKLARIERPADLANLQRWHAEISARPSAAA